MDGPEGPSKLVMNSLMVNLTGCLSPARQQCRVTSACPGQPVAPARRSACARAKASIQRDEFGHPYRSFRGLMAHLATLTRNQVQFAGTQATVPIPTEPPQTSAVLSR